MGSTRFVWVLAAVLAVPGCKGAEGSQGPPGQQGAQGDPGVPGQSVTIAPLAAGDANCPYGGTRFVAGTETSYACNGGPGQQGLRGPGVVGSFYTSEQRTFAASPVGTAYLAKTATWTAGQGQRAYFWATATCGTGGSSVIVVRGGYAAGGGVDTAIGVSGSNGHAPNDLAYPVGAGGVAGLDLEPGSNYVFSAALEGPTSGESCTVGLVVLVIAI